MELDKKTSDQLNRLNHLLDSQLQYIQLQLEIFRVKQDHMSKWVDGRSLFLQEVYEISKIAIGLLVPLAISTYAYPIVPDINTVRFYMFSFIIFFIVIIIMHLLFVRKNQDIHEPAYKAESDLLQSLQELLTDIQGHKTKQLGLLNRELKIELKKRTKSS